MERGDALSVCQAHIIFRGAVGVMMPLCGVELYQMTQMGLNYANGALGPSDLSFSFFA